MKMWVKVLGAIGVLLIAGVVTGIALVTQYDYNKLKPTIAKMAKDATGRDLAIDGDLDLVVSLSPTLSVASVTFANASWGEKGPMVRLDQLVAKVDLMALLQGRVDIDYLVLDGLTVVLETDGKGKANWEFEAPGADAAAAKSEGDLTLIPSARDIRLQNVDVTYIDGATGKRLHLLLARANFAADSFTAPMRATLEAVFQGVNVDATLEMGSLSHLVGSTGDVFPVDMKITAPGLDATVNVTVEQPQAGLNVAGHVDLSVSDSATLAKLAGADLPNLDGLKVAMKVQGGGQQYAFNAIDLSVGGSDLGGDLSVNLAGKRPRVTGKLTSKVLDLDQILGLETPKPASSGLPQVPTAKPDGDAPRLFSAAPLALDGLKAVDADISVIAGRIKVANLPFDAVKAGLKLNAGKLDLKPVSLSLEDGEIDGTLRLNAAAKTPALKSAWTVKDLDVGSLAKAFGMGDFLSLAVNGKVKVNSTGVSVRKLMANMNGSVRLSARDGSINDTTITGLISGLSNELPWVQHEQAGRIICMVADWPIKNGVATARTVLLDTPGFSVALTGNVNLGGERLHLTVVPQAKTASLASFAVPMRLKGAFSAPYIDVDPADAVVGTVENIVKAPVTLLGDLLGVSGNNDTAADPCIKALAGGKTKPAKKAPAEAAPPPPQGKTLGILKPVEELGKSLKSLFGQ